MKFVNFQNSYHINADIFAMLNALSAKSYPVAVRDINVEDTSTNMDYVDTYTVDMEDGYGKRFTLTFDIPKFVNNRFYSIILFKNFLSIFYSFLPFYLLFIHFSGLTTHI